MLDLGFEALASSSLDRLSQKWPPPLGSKRALASFGWGRGLVQHTQFVYLVNGPDGLRVGLSW